ncbi:MAG: response regulator transcription factor [Spartobacteria bacterium]|nr:response regulator transcription factor [Spartobacteria bacterium]
MISILVADDHPIYRKGLLFLLEAEEDMQVTDEADNGVAALALLRSKQYDVVTLDISMPEMGGLEVLNAIKSEQVATYVLMISAYAEEQYAIRSLKCGASGYLGKDTVSDELVVAIRKIAAGGKYISASLGERLACDLQDGTDVEPHERLSAREFDVFYRLAQGQTVSYIAIELNLSVKTVSTHRAHILKKTGMETTAQLMRYAMERSLV